LSGVKVPKKRVLAWVSPTLFGAQVVSEVEQSNVSIPLSDFRSLAMFHTPRIWSRERLKSYPNLWVALTKLWGDIPAFVVLIPITNISPPTVATLGVQTNITFGQLKELALFLNQQAINKNKPIVEKWQRTWNLLEIHPTATIFIDRESNASFLNRAARELLLRDHLLDLELLLGPASFRVLHKKISKRSLFLKFSFQLAPEKILHLGAKIEADEDHIILALQSLGLQTSSQSSSKEPKSTSEKRLIKSVRDSYKKGPQRGKGGQILFWLCSDKLEPVPLGTSYSFTVGRHDQNDLVLRDNEVSRFHATFKVRGRTVILEDHGSSNGVLINGKRQNQHRLSVNDKILIGPYHFVVKSAEDGPPLEVDLAKSAAVPPNPFSGDICAGSLREVLNNLHLQQKTGTLTLLHNAFAGHITMLGGLLHSAEFGALVNKEAIECMLTLKDGHFIFRHERPPVEAGMDLSVSDIFRDIDSQPFENTGALLPGSPGHDIKS
jgi:hypothetical protein